MMWYQHTFVIVQTKQGYFVKSEDGTINAGGPYNIENDAKNRLIDIQSIIQNKK